MKCLLCGRPMQKKITTKSEFHYFGDECVLYIQDTWVIANWCNNNSSLRSIYEYPPAERCTFHGFEKIGEFLYKGFKI